MKEPTQFLTNEKGEKVAVVIGIEEYEKLLEELEDLEDIRAYDEAMASGETLISFEKAIAEIERSRKLATPFSSSLAQRELAALPVQQLEIAQSKIESLRDNPRPAGCKKLADREGWRIRFGDYRILYRIDDATKTVTITNVGNRREICR